MSSALLVLASLGGVYWLLLGRPRVPDLFKPHPRRARRLGGLVLAGFAAAEAGRYLHLFVAACLAAICLSVLITVLVMRRRRIRHR